jgi:hypothetical protein
MRGVGREIAFAILQYFARDELGTDGIDPQQAVRMRSFEGLDVEGGLRCSTEGRLPSRICVAKRAWRRRGRVEVSAGCRFGSQTHSEWTRQIERGCVSEWEG